MLYILFNLSYRKNVFAEVSKNLADIIQTKIFSNLYLVKFLDTSAKLFFLYVIFFIS